MPQAATAMSLAVAERDGPGARLVLRGADADGALLIVVSGYEGPRLPETLTQASLGRGAGAGRWTIAAAEGEFEFSARALDRIRERPALYEPLHRRFALSATDRFAARCLLWMLRLPGGARLMRRWHARRGG